MFPLARYSVLRAARSQLYPSSRALNQTALSRLLSTLAVLEQRDGKLQTSSLAAVAAAQKLGGSITAFVAGNAVKGTAAAEAAKIKGLEKVVAVENAAYDKVCYSQLCLGGWMCMNGLILTGSCRASPRTMPLSSLRTSRTAATPM